MLFILGSEVTWITKNISHLLIVVIQVGQYSNVEFQKAWLGPLLFLFDVNDMPNAVSGEKLRLSADDISWFITGKTVARLEYFGYYSNN